MDTLADALVLAVALLEDGGLKEFVDARYADWNNELGTSILSGKRSLADLAEWAEQSGCDPKPVSGRQEMLENRVRRVRADAS
jgi:xylose isomerase